MFLAQKKIREITRGRKLKGIFFIGGGRGGRHGERVHPSLKKTSGDNAGDSRCILFCLHDAF